MKNSNLLDLPSLDDKPLWDVIAGLVGYQAILVAYDLGLFSYLDKEPKSFIQIAKKLGIEKRPLDAIISTCLSLNFINLVENKYELTDVAKIYLVKSSPFFFGAAYDLIINNFMAYEDVKKAVLTNKPVAYGEKEIFVAHEEQMQLAKEFTRAMHSASMAPALCWPKKIDLSSYSTLLDIGGGSGAHTIGALNMWVNLTGIVLEIAPVCEVCDEIFKQYNLNERAGSIAGDFWECEFPKADVHFYSQIFHDWPTEKCQFLSKKSFEYLPNNGKIIIHEILADDDKSGPFVASAGSVAMVGWTEGKQYSGAELTLMLTTAGFNSVEIIPTFGYWSIVIGTK